jgi:coenzyme A diphosphatase NUDT7
LIDKLERNPEEVDDIFTHPLRGVMDGKVDGNDAEGLVEIGGRWWPHEEEYHVRSQLSILG